MKAPPPEAHEREFTCGREIFSPAFLLKGGEVGFFSGKNRSPLITGAFPFDPQPAFFHAWRFILSGYNVMEGKAQALGGQYGKENSFNGGDFHSWLPSLERLEKTRIPNPANRNREMQKTIGGHIGCSAESLLKNMQGPFWESD